MKITFLVNPEGRVFEDSVATSFEQSMRQLINSWLPPDIFGRYETGRPYSYGISHELWKAMEAKGWTKAQITMPQDDETTEETS